MPRTSAGLVMLNPQGQLLLVHPGGPFFKRRDAGVWGIPKGMAEPGEELLATAVREFAEELGFTPELPAEPHPLGRIRQSGGKTVTAWAFVGQWDPSQLCSNTFEVEWPPRSGNSVSFPEVDRAQFFSLEECRIKVVPAQLPLLERASAWFEGLSPSHR